MDFDKSFQVERCVTRDTTQRPMLYVMLNVEGKRLIAVDGYMLASVPCNPDEGDTSGLLTTEAIKAARKAAGKLRPRIVANGSQAILGGPTFPRPTEDNVGKFPPVDSVIPKYREESEGTITIGLNANLLAELSKAIGSSGVVSLTFETPPTEGKDRGFVSSAIVVQDVNGDRSATGPLGVLMPARTRSRAR